MIQYCNFSGQQHVPASAGNMSYYEYSKRCGGFRDKEDLKKEDDARKSIINLLYTSKIPISIEDISNILKLDPYHVVPAIESLVNSGLVARRLRTKGGTHVYYLPDRLSECLTY